MISERTIHSARVWLALLGFSLSILLSVGCGKRGGKEEVVILTDQKAASVPPPEARQDKVIEEDAPQGEAAPPPEEPVPVVEDDPLAGYERGLVIAVARGIDHFAGLLEVPYGRIERHMLAAPPRNLYGTNAKEEKELMDMLNLYSSQGLIRYTEIDLEKEHLQRHADKIMKPVRVHWGREYMVSITRKAYNNLASEITTPRKVYVRRATSKVTKIIKNVGYTSPALSVSEDYRMVLGTAEMHPNPGLFEANHVPPVEEVKFRAILHVNPFTGAYSPLCVDVGYPASSGWHTDRIPSQQYGSPYDLSTTVSPPEPVGDPELTREEIIQSIELLSEKLSPSGKYTIRKLDITARDREMVVLSDRDNKLLYTEKMLGPLGEVHWGPDEKAVAFHEGNGDAIEGAWVVRLDPPGLVKGITDEFSTLFNKMAVAEMASTADGLSPDADDVPETIRTKVIGWEDASTVRIRVSAHYLPSDKILEMDALLDITKEGENAIHFPARAAEAALNTGASTPKPADEWKPLVVSGLYDSESIAINLGSGLVSFGMSWMTRIGATQAIGRFEDVDWQRAKIVEEVAGGAFEGTVLIEIPLKPDTGFVIKTWVPSQEHPEQPWAEGIKPDQEKKSGASLSVHAMNRADAESVVRKLHTMGDASDAATPGADGQDEDAGGCQAPELLDGEMYPLTRLEPIREEDYSDLTEDQLRHAINEMFARHGAAFGRPEVTALFQDKPWYQPQPDLTLKQIEKEKFSDVERANLLKLAELRNRKKGSR